MNQSNKAMNDPLIWKVVSAFTGTPQPTNAPPQLEDVLNNLEADGWTIFQILNISEILEVKVVAFKYRN
jgi:hypothetical protein